MRFSVQIETHLGFDWQASRKIAETSEASGYHAIYFCDHLTGRTEELALRPNLECWTSLASLASVTNTIHLGTLVSAVGFRNPALLAKIAATLDVISQGRLEFGVGAGWFEPEYRAFGYYFPKTSLRIEQLAEAIQIIRKMWTEERPTFEGKHFSIRNAPCNPKPLQKPTPTIWVGGTGERVMQTIAKYADGWNASFLSMDDYTAKCKTLEAVCSQIGRDPRAIKRSYYTSTTIAKNESTLKKTLAQIASRYGHSDESFEEFAARIRHDTRRITGTPDEITEKVDAFRKLGVEEIISFFSDMPALDQLRLWGEEIIPRFSE